MKHLNKPSIPPQWLDSFRAYRAVYVLRDLSNIIQGNEVEFQLP